MTNSLVDPINHVLQLDSSLGQLQECRGEMTQNCMIPRWFINSNKMKTRLQNVSMQSYVCNLSQWIPEIDDLSLFYYIMALCKQLRGTFELYRIKLTFWYYTLRTFYDEHEKDLSIRTKIPSLASEGNACISDSQNAFQLCCLIIKEVLFWFAHLTAFFPQSVRKDTHIDRF